MAALRPLCICLAGPNGSGKSTFARRLEPLVGSDFWIDPDRIAEHLRQSRGLPELSPDLATEAFNAARNLRADFAEGGLDFGFETVFSHESNSAFIRALKAIGYEVHLYFVGTTDANINVLRVQARVMKGGHSVPDEKVRARYLRSLQLLALTVREPDRTFLFDNSEHGMDAHGRIRPGRLICEISGDDGGDNFEKLQVFPPMPTWVMTYGLFPFATSWPVSTLCREALRRFGDGIQFTGDVSDVQEFLNQFRF